MSVDRALRKQALAIQMSAERAAFAAEVVALRAAVAPAHLAKEAWQTVLRQAMRHRFFGAALSAVGARVASRRHRRAAGTATPSESGLSPLFARLLGHQPLLSSAVGAVLPLLRRGRVGRVAMAGLLAGALWRAWPMVRDWRQRRG